MVLSYNDELFVWGENSFGQLGLGEHNNEYCSPTKLHLQNILTISCSEIHTIFLSKNKKLFVCGANEDGPPSQRGSDKFP